MLQLKRRRKRPTDYLLILNSKKIGAVSIKPIKPHWCLVQSVHIRKNYRGKGYGKFLMAKVLEKAKAKGLPKVVLTCRKNNKTAISLYKKLGFKIDYSMVIDQVGNEPPLWWMEKAL
jgi:ribosomal protein S18 acetylase RimI-like enzyme